jgi:elongator complex protein 1
MCPLKLIFSVLIIYSEFISVTSWDAPCPNPELDCDEVLSLHYFGDSLTTCLVLAGGDIVVVREEPLSGEDRIEIVGSVDAGITAAEWSPDEELLAITTKADTVVFMSRSFEGITDIAMTADDLKASNHVSVGWGKKETQFQGKGAKALRDPTMPEKIDEGVLSSNDDSKAAITWRGDGAYLAISTIEGGARRIIRVYSREGVLDSVSEPIDGLEGALSWRPAGNLIAGIQRLEDRVDVVFFERNGLRHGQFSLRLTAEQLQAPGQHIKLSWNSDSTVLAVVLADCTQLWTMGNYHWYLKQEIKIRLLLEGCSLVWHPEKALRFVAAASGEVYVGCYFQRANPITDSIHVVEYIFSTARASTLPPQDHGVVAVLDGQSIKLTPFKTANIPPPMALHEFMVSSNAIDIAFNGNASLIAVLHQQGISIFDWKSVSASASGPVLTGRITFGVTESQIGNYQQVSFGVKDQVIALQRQNQSSILKYFDFNDDTGRMEQVESDEHPSSAISNLSSFSQNGLSHPFVQSKGGDLHSLVLGEDTLSHCSLPVYLPWVEIIPHVDTHIAFGMSNNGHLYANSRLLVKNCTSFLVTSAHLIFTTTTHLLKFVHITDVNGTVSNLSIGVILTMNRP